MASVSFNSVAEFVEELRKDSGRVERGIVRLTNLYTPARESPSIRYLSVVATCLVDGHIIRLDRFCGTIWGLDGDRDREVYEKAGQYQREIEAACGELGLEVRSGVFEKADHAGQ
jgi:hypothetical protein